MAEYYRQSAFMSSVLAGFAFSFAGTLLVASREHRAGAWAAFLALAASVAFLPVTLGMTFRAVGAASQSAKLDLQQAAADHYIQMLSMLFLSGIFFLVGSFGVSGWMRSRGLGIATTVLAVIGVIVIFLALRPFLYVPHAP
jgi:hypothetical protein